MSSARLRKPGEQTGPRGRGAAPGGEPESGTRRRVRNVNRSACAQDDQTEVVHLQPDHGGGGEKTQSQQQLGGVETARMAHVCEQQQENLRAAGAHTANRVERQILEETNT